MTLYQFELYKEYRQTNDTEIRYEIGRDIVKANKKAPIPWYWCNDSDPVLPREEWGPINFMSFAPFYEISNYGRLKRLKRIVGYRNGNPKNWPERIIKPTEKSQGRLRITLEVNKRREQISMHRAVANTFIKNPFNKPTVNHIDGDPKNCHFLNLEWATFSENELHSYRVLGKESNPQKGVLSPLWKGPINCLTKDGHIVKRYDCAVDVSKDGFHASQVYRVANGIRKTTGGFLWRWA